MYTETRLVRSTEWWARVQRGVGTSWIWRWLFKSARVAEPLLWERVVMISVKWWFSGCVVKKSSSSRCARERPRPLEEG